MVVSREGMEPFATPEEARPASPSYPAVMVCSRCGSPNDVWAEACGCGNELLPDTRHLKLSKKGGSLERRLSGRAHELALSERRPDLEQAVRDLAALRAGTTAEGHADYLSHTQALVRTLLKLDSLPEATAEAGALAGARWPASPVYLDLAKRHEAIGDTVAADTWWTRAIELAKSAKERIPLACERAGFLVDRGNPEEAVRLLEQVESDLDAARKKTSKGLGAQITGGGAAMASGYWSSETKAVHQALDRARAAVAVRELAKARAVASEAATLEAQGDVEGALRRFEVAEQILSARSTTRAFQRDDARAAKAMLKEVHAARKRLKKLRKAARV